MEFKILKKMHIISVIDHKPRGKILFEIGLNLRCNQISKLKHVIQNLMTEYLVTMKV